MSKYDITPATDNPPDFTYDESKATDEEVEYVLAYLILLGMFYDTYKYKSVDYVIDNVEKDVKTLEQDFLKENKKLDKFHDESEQEYLKKEGVVVGKIKKGKNRIKNFVKGENPYDDLINEQKVTISSITLTLGLGILTSAYYSKVRNEPKLFNIDSNLRDAVTRTQNMASAGYTSTKGLAQNKVLKFMYGEDVLMDWITHSEDSEGGVCPNCQEIEDKNPHKLSDIPLNRLHPHCCCTRELHDKKDSLMGRALDLIFY